MLDKPRCLKFPRDINKSTAFAFQFDEIVSALGHCLKQVQFNALLDRALLRLSQDLAV